MKTAEETVFLPHPAGVSRPRAAKVYRFGAKNRARERNQSGAKRGLAPALFSATGAALGSHLCVALSSVQVRQT
jgi:hypothetical protein